MYRPNFWFSTLPVSTSVVIPTGGKVNQLACDNGKPSGTYSNICPGVEGILYKYRIVGSKFYCHSSDFRSDMTVIFGIWSVG